MPVDSEIPISNMQSVENSLFGHYVTLYNTIHYKTYNAPYVTRMLFVGAGMTRD